MKSTIWTGRARAFGLAAWVGLSGPLALATPIAVTNPSFELPSLGDNRTSQRNIPGWIGTDPGISNNFGVFNPPIRYFPHEAPDGRNVAYTERGAIYQALAESLLPNQQYCLQVQVGNSLVDEVSPFRIEIRAGGNILASSSPTPPPKGTFRNVVVNYVSSAVSGDIGKPLEIRFVELTPTLTTEVYYDDVRFSKSPVPDTWPPLLGVTFAFTACAANTSRWRCRS